MKKLTQNFALGSALLLANSAFAASTFTAGHADVIALGYEGGAFEPHFHHDDNAVIDGNLVGVVGEFEPGEIITVVPQTTFDYVQDVVGGRPPGSAWDPIGVDAGTSFWFISQNSNGPGGADTLGSPFAGIGLEELLGSDWVGPISLQLVNVSGPGDFSLYLTDLAGPTFFWSTSDGLDASDVLTQEAGTHEHYNWAFTAPGDYDITVQFDGEHVTDGDQTATATFSFRAVPEPSTTLLGALSLFALAARRRR